MIALVFLVAFLGSFAAARDTDFCYAEEAYPYLMFGTKTAYLFINEGKKRFDIIPHCKPIQMWVLARHGSSYPSKSSVTKLLTLPRLRDQIVYNHDTLGNGHLCDKDLDNLKNWRLDPSMNQDNADDLATQGEEDMDLLARRLQNSFPELLQPKKVDITEANYKFRASSSQSAKASMQFFMKGLFGGKDAVPAQQAPENDTLLKAYNVCEEWQTEVNGKPETHMEATRFLDGPEYQNLLQNVSRRLGFKQKIATSIGLMYDMCRYEKAWTVSKVSSWCAVFSSDELRVLEYQEDLEYYYNYGHGNKLNARVGCPPMRDMFQNFMKLENDDYSGNPQGIFYFTEASTLQLFFAAMGIAKDSTPLLSTNYQTMKKRHWQTSQISSFANNVVAIFYKCDRGQPGDLNKVMFYHAETPIRFDECEVGLCDWEALKRRFSDALTKCNKNFCEAGNGVSTIGTTVIPMLVSLVTLFVSRL